MSRAIARGQAEYPSRLFELRRPPPTIYLRGSLPAGSGVAVVGTRRPGAEAERFARWLGARLARAGVAVWSGGALGIDAAAHEGALEAGGVTVLVAGGALDAPYPACHRGLYERVEAAGGALVSLLADGQRPRPWGFLERNRVLAALTTCTVVVECPLKSGARSTAAAARHLGRPVWVAAQPPWAPRLAAAVREEVRLGAQLLLRADDLLASLGGAASAAREYEPGAGGVEGGEVSSGRRAGAADRGEVRAGTWGTTRSSGGAVVGASGPARERGAVVGASRPVRGQGARGRGPGDGAAVPVGAEAVWRALVRTGGATHLDVLCSLTGLGVGRVQYGLTLLLLSGWVDEGPAGQFCARKGPGAGV
jgi:DNA processing protein